MNKIELLAKAPTDDQRVTLSEHTKDVVSSAECMFGNSDDRPTRLSKEWLRFFKIAPEHFVAFRANLLAAAWSHDWGKANDGFINAVTRRDEQVIRHEHLSALLLGLESVTEWLRKNHLIDIDLVLSAVLTHHLKAKPELVANRLCDVRFCRVYTDHDEFKQLVREMAESLSLDGLPAFPRERFWGFLPDGKESIPGVISVAQKREDLKRRLRQFEEELKDEGEDKPRTRMLWAVRSALITADAAGSGLKRERKEILAWLETAFENPRVWDKEAVWREVIDKRVKQITEQCERQKKPPFQWIRFQENCDRLGSRTLMLAPCGSGKTLAAWRWIAAQLQDYPRKRIIFLYPTRATAKEGFRDYVSWAPEAAAGLIHSTAAYDLQGMFANTADSRSQNRYEVERKLYALGFWTKQIFSATVDQFLAFMQYSYSSICMLPALADSVVVIDEVHSFDHNMLSVLKSFLKNFEVPVLCMTATLPSDQRRSLTDDGELSPYEDREGELKKVAEAERYHLERLPSDPLEARKEVRGRILQALREGRRVLWVVNQVKKAQQAAIEMARDFLPDRAQEKLHVADVPGDVRLFCYHSRFRLQDRVKRHEEVVGSMGANAPKQPALAITTQVCEMSLDLDVDLLVTEECPITSLIQRMGRCNRSKHPRPLTAAGEVLVYQPTEDGKLDYRPYTPDQLLGLSDFLSTLEKLPSLNQIHLENELARAPTPSPIGDRASMFLDSGAYAQAGEESFRDIEDFTAESVLADEVRNYLGAAPNEKPGFLTPVPLRFCLSKDELAKRQDQSHARLPRYIRMAPETHYHAALGFCDVSLAEMKGGA